MSSFLSLEDQQKNYEKYIKNLSANKWKYINIDEVKAGDIISIFYELYTQKHLEYLIPRIGVVQEIRIVVDLEYDCETKTIILNDEPNGHNNIIFINNIMRLKKMTDEPLLVKKRKAEKDTEVTAEDDNAESLDFAVSSPSDDYNVSDSDDEI